MIGHQNPREALAASGAASGMEALKEIDAQLPDYRHAGDF